MPALHALEVYLGGLSTAGQIISVLIAVSIAYVVLSALKSIGRTR